MRLNERQEQILQKLHQKRRISVSALASELYVSEMTIRRDLTAMEKAGLLARCHGGAVALADEAHSPIDLRSSFMDAEKKRVAAKAAAHLADGQTVFLDSSSTAAYLVPYIARHKNMRIITNSIRTLLELGEHHLPTILLGGEYFEKDMCTLGDASPDAMQFNVDIAFFSCTGLSDDGRLTDHDFAQASIRRQILHHAKKSVCLMLPSKKGKVFPFTICRLQDTVLCI